jgi:hypothetical protein
MWESDYFRRSPRPGGDRDELLAVYVEVDGVAIPVEFDDSDVCLKQRIITVDALAESSETAV